MAGIAAKQLGDNKQDRRGHRAGEHTAGHVRMRVRMRMLMAVRMNVHRVYCTALTLLEALQDAQGRLEHLRSELRRLVDEDV